MPIRIGIVEHSPGEWQVGRGRSVMQRAMAGAGLETDMIRSDDGAADVLIYLFNWKDSLGLLAERIGRSVPLKKARGYCFADKSGKVLIPTYHPHLVGAGAMHLLPLLVWDLKLAASNPAMPTFPTEDLILAPSPDELREFLATNVAWLVVDLETVGSMDDEEDMENPGMQIVRASLARPDCKAITFPWQEPFVSIFKNMVENQRPGLVGWNSHDFDWPRLREAGFRLDNNRLVDAMWLYKYLQPRLPRGLGAVSTLYGRTPEWKSLAGSDEELYSAMDARQTAKIYICLEVVLRSRQV